MEIVFDPLVNWEQVLAYVAKLVFTCLLTLPIAWDRQQQTRIMGLRTFPLVAVASCGYVLIAISMSQGNPDTEARALQGLITGIGFIGGGAILKHENGVSGTATASSIWATGAMGAAVGFGSVGIALVIALITFLILRVFTKLESEIDWGKSGSENEVEV
jgi:putative Mg2+ transporter-C (MgtC) family protein